MKVVSLLFAALVTSVKAIELDTNSHDSIYAACQLLATGVMDYYWGYDYGGTVGMFTHPYYWWEAGGALGTILDYSYLFENDTYVNTIITAVMYQKGEDSNFMPLNQTTTEGNDDQVFWGITAMQAAERNFTNPPNPKDPSWLELAQATFNTMKNRWDTEHCGGGLRWQIFTWNSGYTYKNTVSNAGLFHLGSRLLRYTANESYYLDWCEKSYDWLVDIGFINEEKWLCYDGADISTNCTEKTPYLWSYNLALVISGCAYMYNYTGDDVWYERVHGFLDTASLFFDSQDVMYEPTCMPSHCQTDQRSFRAYLGRFLGLVSVLVPDTYDTIHHHLVDTANGIAQSCVGGYDGHTCGMNWSYSGWDGYYGLGEEMSALDCLQALTVLDRPAPYTLMDGASSTGDVLFGNETYVATAKSLNLNKGDTAGASIITVIIGITILVLGYFVII